LKEEIYLEYIDIKVEVKLLQMLQSVSFLHPSSLKEKRRVFRSICSGSFTAASLKGKLKKF